MTPDEFKALYPTLANLDLPPRPPEQAVDRSIKKADLVNPTDPALVQRFGKPRQGAVVWDDQCRMVKTEEEMPDEA